MTWGRVTVKLLTFIKICRSVMSIIITCKVSFVKWIFQTLTSWNRKDKDILTLSESYFPAASFSHVRASPSFSKPFSRPMALVFSNFEFHNLPLSNGNLWLSPIPSTAFSFPPSFLPWSHLALVLSGSLETGFSSAFTRPQGLPLGGNCPVQKGGDRKLRMAGENRQSKALQTCLL